MPLGIAPADRKLLLIGGALLILLLTASVILAPPAEDSDLPFPSTYSAQSGGAAAAYRLLSQLHYPVRRWEEPPTELGDDSSDILLILALPLQPPSTKEREALTDFVEGGGHVLFTGSNIQPYFPDAHVSTTPPDPVWKSFSPSIPNHLVHGAQRVTIQPHAYWGDLEGSQIELYGEAGSPAVVSWKLGDGEILWWAGSTPLTNAGITRDENLAFFLNCVANWSPGEPYRIYWDEYFHGQRSSLWSYIGKTSVPWSLLQFGLLAFAVLFTFSRRSGPTYIPAAVSRLSPLEFVDTLGGLYERAGAASSAVAISYSRLRSLLTRQLSLPANFPDADLAQSAEQRLGWKNSGLSALLARALVSTRVAKLPPREALDLVQKLEAHAARLTIRPQIRREKT
jgi:hypothetical protein